MIVEKTPQPRNRPSPSNRYRIDGAYVREQASEAVRMFVAPFTGVYRALTAADNAAKAIAKPKRSRRYLRAKNKAAGYYRIAGRRIT